MAKMEINILNLDLFKKLVSALEEHRDNLPTELQKSLDEIANANKIEKFKNFTSKDFMKIIRSRDK